MTKKHQPMTILQQRAAWKLYKDNYQVFTKMEVLVHSSQLLKVSDK